MGMPAFGQDYHVAAYLASQTHLMKKLAEKEGAGGSVAGSPVAVAGGARVRKGATGVTNARSAAERRAAAGDVNASVESRIAAMDADAVAGTARKGSADKVLAEMAIGDPFPDVARAGRSSGRFQDRRASSGVAQAVRRKGETSWAPRKVVKLPKEYVPSEVRPLDIGVRKDRELIRKVADKFTQRGGNSALLLAFRKSDEDRNGTVDYAEFKKCLEDANFVVSQDEMHRLFKTLDVNGTGDVDYSEWCETFTNFAPLKETRLNEIPESTPPWEVYKDADPIGHAMENVWGEEQEHAVQKAAELMELKDSAQAGFAIGSRELQIVDEKMMQIVREKIERVSNKLRHVFRKFDMDKSGSIDKEEFHHAIRSMRLGLSQRQIDRLWTKVDADGSGDISYEEFITKFDAYDPLSGVNGPERSKGVRRPSQAFHVSGAGARKVQEELKSAIAQRRASVFQTFKAMDEDGNGALNGAELTKGVATMLPSAKIEDIKNFVRQVDTNGDGVMDYSEFLAVVDDYGSEGAGPMNDWHSQSRPDSRLRQNRMLFSQTLNSSMRSMLSTGSFNAALFNSSRRCATPLRGARSDINPGSGFLPPRVEGGFTGLASVGGELGRPHTVPSSVFVQRSATGEPVRPTGRFFHTPHPVTSHVTEPLSGSAFQLSPRQAKNALGKTAPRTFGVQEIVEGDRNAKNARNAAVAKRRFQAFARQTALAADDIVKTDKREGANLSFKARTRNPYILNRLNDPFRPGNIMRVGAE